LLVKRQIFSGNFLLFSNKFLLIIDNLRIFG